MDEYVFGANILENLTTGMYQDSRVIYREYIQNACDQIDIARREGLLVKGQELIDIQLDERKRTITITDNATGIPSSEFKEILANIADSNKQIGEAKGFRGIGRLCGLAYCRELVFSSKAPGEKQVNILRCYAAKMRELIDKNNRGEKVSAQEVLNEIYEFPEPLENVDEADHWFKVELIEVNHENHALLQFQDVKDYLSFVAPVPYKNTFIFKPRVYEHANELGVTIDEYNIRLNGEPIVKNYSTRFSTSKGEDEIFNISFKDFYNDSNQLIAWSWIGVSHFKAVIYKECQMRGLRLRKENIQIGNEEVLKKFFKEDRGVHYFIGEVFAVSKNLIPNSQRDYFNENIERLEFERAINSYCKDDLTRLYREGSVINTAFNKIDAYQKKVNEFQRKQQNGEFVDDAHIQQEVKAVEKAKIDAEKAQKDIEKQKNKADQDPANPASMIISRIERERSGQQVLEKKERESASGNDVIEKNEKGGRRVDKLSSLQKRDRKLLSKIFSIILSSTDAETAEIIISRIEEEFK